MTRAATDDLFFSQTGLDRNRVERIVGEALTNADDGELFLEYRQSEALAFDDGRLKMANFDTTQGFGLRCVAGESTGYAHASELSEAALNRASEAVQAVKQGRSFTLAEGPKRTNIHLYPDENPLGAQSFAEKARLLADIDAYARAKDARVRQVSTSLTGEWQAVEIIRPDGLVVRDVRPLVRRRGRQAGSGQLRCRRTARIRHIHRPDAVAGPGRRGAAPGARQSGIGARARGRDGCRARARLARHPAP